MNPLIIEALREYLDNLVSGSQPIREDTLEKGMGWGDDFSYSSEHYLPSAALLNAWMKTVDGSNIRQRDSITKVKKKKKRKESRY